MPIWKKSLLSILLIIILGFILPQHFVMPVKHAHIQDYNQQSFWYHPWGKSITHKGVDIFAKEGTEVNSSITGIVLYAGDNSMGGQVVIVLGAKWRLHYFAHLKTIHTTTLAWVNRHSLIGRVGATGNAIGKQPHLHYSIFTPIPYIWNYDTKAPQGWLKVFFINPVELLNQQF